MMQSSIRQKRVTAQIESTCCQLIEYLCTGQDGGRAYEKLADVSHLDILFFKF